MRVDVAKGIARAWVLREASNQPGFQGAHFAGSVNWLPDDADLPATSDLDVAIVIDGADVEAGRRKLVEDGVLIEASTRPLDLLRTPEKVLGDYALAGGFHVPSVIVDRTGWLTKLQQEVARQFAEPVWVRRRCEDARTRSLGYLSALSVERPFYLQAVVWAFGTSLMSLVPIIAALRNPTVRRRYVAVRELLAERNRLDLYEHMLELLGCAQMSRERVEHHLTGVANVYDATVPQLKSSFPFAADISRLSRHVAIDGSGDLIERGLHREAVWWLVATYARCLEVLTTDAPSLAHLADDGLRALLADLGIAGFDDFLASAERTRALLPEVWAVAEELITEL